MNGLIQLKIAYIKYSLTPTLRTLDWYAPQVFHGINADVTVPESSSVLLKFSGARFRSLYAFENIFPGITIAKYWSEAVKLIVKHVATVLANN